MRMTLLRLYWAAALPLAAGTTEAVRYLTDEVPRWKVENACYSCHNNGDGARALFAAAASGVAVDQGAVRDTLQYLGQPSRWEEPKPLARVQFAAALLAARDAKLLADPAPLQAAATMLEKDQASDGRVKVDEEKVEGSPATYGPIVATWLTAKVFRAAGRTESAQRAERYLAAQASWRMAAILQSQAGNGSWKGEPYDTALAILRLRESQDRASVREAIDRGRAYLRKTQLGPGGWPATTRPSGGHSYAQHISTTAWCLMALLD